MNSDGLWLHEEILLMALNDKSGKVDVTSWYAYAIGGALLTELVLASRVRLETEGKQSNVRLSDPQPLGEPVLDECLEKIEHDGRSRRPDHWVSIFANLKELKHRIAAGLCDRGILRMDKDKILGLFERRLYPEVNPEPERAMITRLRRAIFTDQENVDARTIVLIGLTEGSGLLQSAFDKKQLKSRRSRIEGMIKGDIAGAATREALEAAQTAAIMVSVILPTVMASTMVATN